jgi:hypothetical protein
MDWLNTPPQTAVQTQVDKIVSANQTIMLGESTSPTDTTNNPPAYYHAGPWWSSWSGTQPVPAAILQAARQTLSINLTDLTSSPPPLPLPWTISPTVLRSNHGGIVVVTFFDGHTAKIPVETPCDVNGVITPPSP